MNSYWRMLFIAVVFLQVLLNEQILHEFEMPAQYYGYVCGTVMILNGIFCTFTAAYKTYYLYFKYPQI